MLELHAQSEQGTFGLAHVRIDCVRSVSARTVRAGDVGPDGDAIAWAAAADVVADDEVGAAVAVHVAGGAGEVVACHRFDGMADELAAGDLFEHDDGMEAEFRSLREELTRQEGDEGHVEQTVAVEIGSDRAPGAVAVGQAVRRERVTSLVFEPSNCRDTA